MVSDIALHDLSQMINKLSTTKGPEFIRLESQFDMKVLNARKKLELLYAIDQESLRWYSQACSYQI